MKTRIQAFIQLVKHHNLSYNQELKDVFHKEGRAILKHIAKEMGLDSYQIRSNQGGIAVSGEVILHSKSLYVQFSQFGYVGFMYRSCDGLDDYTGGINQWMAWETLQDISKVVETFNRISAPPPAK